MLDGSLTTSKPALEVFEGEFLEVWRVLPKLTHFQGVFVESLPRAGSSGNHATSIAQVRELVNPAFLVGWGYENRKGKLEKENAKIAGDALR